MPLITGAPEGWLVVVVVVVADVEVVVVATVVLAGVGIVGVTGDPGSQPLPWGELIPNRRAAPQQGRTGARELQGCMF